MTLRKSPTIGLNETWQMKMTEKNSNFTCTKLLVSTYIVCERLSVMHEPAGVVENLVQILQFTPILQYRIPPPPPEMKIVRNLGTLTFQLQNTPPPPGNENCQKSWHFDF